MAKQISWDPLRGANIPPQSLDWDGNDLRLGSNGNTITVGAADLVTMLIFVLDTSVTNEALSPGGDKYYKARNALGGSAGATYAGHTAAVTTARGLVLTHTASGNTFDVAESHRFAVAVANLCQSGLPDTAGLLARM